MLRRSFLGSIVAGLSLAWTNIRFAAAADPYAFDHGVASGDPLSDGVVLWTRLSGAGEGSHALRWQVATDAEMTRVVRQGIVWTDGWLDYTVKVDVRGLQPGTRYFYRFDIGDVASPVGRTRTLPAGTVESAAFAVVSCSNHPAGFFHVYREIAAQDDLDAVIHLGDYIYEYALGEYATERAEALDRIPEPMGETVSLDDYRQRHAQYKADPDSMAMLARHPLIAVWDDHEIVNDAWRGGAQNHQGDEGSWTARRDAAIRAYHEWMPIRSVPDGADTRIFRHFRFGNLASLTMLDTRLFGRDRQPDVGENVTPETIQAVMEDPERSLMGRRQEGWLRRKLAGETETTWQLIGQQVMLAPVRAPELESLIDPDKPSLLSREQIDHYTAASRGNPPLILDTWNGYPYAREAFLADLEQYARNPVVLSGDLHTSMASDVYRAGGEAPVTVEIMTSSVTSPGFAEYLPMKRPEALSEATRDVNPFVRYMETKRRGWVHVALSHEACQASWHLVDTVHARDYTAILDRELVVRADRIAEGLGDARVDAR